MSELSSILAPGALIQGRYRVVRSLRAGAMGAVFEVWDVRTDAPRALKVMLPHVAGDAALRARFELEARIVGRIESEHVVRVFDAGVDERSGMPFLVMELLRGEDLRSALRLRGALPAGEVIVYLAQVARALDKLHAAGIVHRDLKPENLFLTLRDDGSPCVKILDFGVARCTAGRSGEGTLAVGTPLYMAPEQILGDGSVGPAADIYALGHIAYALLTGRPYWDNSSPEEPPSSSLLARVLHGVTEPPSARAARRGHPRLSGMFDAWFLRVTDVHPERRFAYASEACAALERAVEAGAAPGEGGAQAAPARESCAPAESARSLRPWLSAGQGSAPGLRAAQAAHPDTRTQVGSLRRFRSITGVLVTIGGVAAGAAAIALAGTRPVALPPPQVAARIGKAAARLRVPTESAPAAPAQVLPAAPEDPRSEQVAARPAPGLPRPAPPPRKEGERVAREPAAMGPSPDARKEHRGID